MNPLQYAPVNMPRILVIEDDQNSREAMATYLISRGFEVQAAADGTEAMTIGRAFSPDLIISDWMLDGNYNGVDVVQILYRQNPNFAVIFISAFPLDQLDAQSRELPVKGLLSKPISLAKLNQLVEQTLRSIVAGYDNC